MSEEQKNLKDPVFIISDSPEKQKAAFNFEEDGRTLARLIANKQNKTPLVVGIYGPWGSGKTTLMETIRRQLQDVPGEDGGQYRSSKTVWFQAWKYKNEEEILAALLETILKQMKEDGFLGWLKGKTEEAVARLDPLKAIKGLSQLLGGKLDVTKFVDQLPYRGKLGFYDIFRNFFQRLIWDYLKWRPQLKKSEKVNDGDVALVVFIDDLDRCPTGKIIQVLETLKLFMDEEGCVFVIGAADEIIEKALQDQYKGEDARKFLEKIVQVSFHLPEIREDFGRYIESLHDEIGPAVQPHLPLILPALGHNIRRLKGFLNNLSLRAGILQGRGISMDFDLLLHWNILEQVSREFINEVKRQGPQVYESLQENIRKLNLPLKVGQVWEPSEEILNQVQQSLRGFCQNRVLVETLNSFQASKDQIRQLITLSQVVKTIEEPLIEHRAGNFEAMARISEGSFLYGDKKKSQEIEKPFWIDIYPVTNQEFEKFILAGGYQNNGYWRESGIAWRDRIGKSQPEYWGDKKWNEPDLPVVGVSFFEADAFAKWKGKRLPTEIEWERAARGTDGRVYPWGDEFDLEKCNSKESDIGKTTSVLKYPNGISPEGCYDMAGNIWEWTASFYDDDKDRYVLRGGSWDFISDFCRCAARNGLDPGGRYDGIGFRCARS
jgi:formylglycine-generating enzyme required for sulfatase activity